MLLRTDVYESLAGMAKEVEQSMRELRQDPKKYLRIKIF